MCVLGFECGRFIKQDPFAVLLLRATFLKLASVLELPLVRINQVRYLRYTSPTPELWTLHLEQGRKEEAGKEEAGRGR